MFPATRALLAASFVLFVITACEEKAPPGTEKQIQPEDLVVELEAGDLSHHPTVREVHPYSDALVMHEYKARKILRGDPGLQGKTIRVAHWAVLRQQAQPLVVKTGDVRRATLVPFQSLPGLEHERTFNTLDTALDTPEFLDLSQTVQAPSLPESIRYEYHISGAPRMESYWKLRAQLKLVVMGTSHAEVGIKAREFYPGENAITPVTLNLSQSGSAFPLQQTLVEEYILDLPALEWVVWGISPRIFNRKFADGKRIRAFTGSPGYKFDRQHREKLWPVPKTADRVRFDEIRDQGTQERDLWGWGEKLRTDFLRPYDDKLRAQITASFQKTNFDWEEPAWEAFVNLVERLEARGVRTCLFTVPFHPLSAGQPSVDDDKTDRASYEELVRRLTDLAAKHPGVVFEDINNGGLHEFNHDDFADKDHLDESGADRLTRRIIELTKGHTKS